MFFKNYIFEIFCAKLNSTCWKIQNSFFKAKVVLETLEHGVDSIHVQISKGNAESNILELFFFLS